jgi:hypothetical protein
MKKSTGRPLLIIHPFSDRYCENLMACRSLFYDIQPDEIHDGIRSRRMRPRRFQDYR